MKHSSSLNEFKYTKVIKMMTKFIMHPKCASKYRGIAQRYKSLVCVCVIEFMSCPNGEPIAKRSATAFCKARRYKNEDQTHSNRKFNTFFMLFCFSPNLPHREYNVVECADCFDLYHLHVFKTILARFGFITANPYKRANMAQLMEETRSSLVQQ